MGFLKKLIQNKKQGLNRQTSGGGSECTLNVENVILLKTLGTGSFGRVFLAKVKNSPEYSPLAVKRLKKAIIISQKQVDHILSEKYILSKIKHPFIINLVGSYKDDKFLYIAMEYVIGGEFFTYLRKIKRCDELAARFYAAQVVSIFEYLHEKNIIYRDLKPENLLLDSHGYLKLTDFGFAKIIEYRTFTLCGTPEYIAPEILLNRGHGKPVDWWTLGILIYEMVVGYPPFFDDDPMGIYQKILRGKIVFPSFFPKNAKSLVRKLLSADLSKRFGNLSNGIEDIKQHKWFEGLPWESLLKKELKSPYSPQYKGEDDTSNFDPYDETIDNPPPIVGDADPFVDW